LWLYSGKKKLDFYNFIDNYDNDKKITYITPFVDNIIYSCQGTICSEKNIPNKFQSLGKERPTPEYKFLFFFILFL